MGCLFVNRNFYVHNKQFKPEFQSILFESHQCVLDNEFFVLEQVNENSSTTTPEAPLQFAVMI